MCNFSSLYDLAESICVDVYTTIMQLPGFTLEDEVVKGLVLSYIYK
jgi:hypothetical protein